MAKPDHKELIKLGVDAWNEWRSEDLLTIPNLQGAQLSGMNLTRANFTYASFSQAVVSKANLSEALLTWADLTEINFKETNLTNADLTAAVLADADLENANLSGSDLTGANFSGANLNGADLNAAIIGFTTFANNDLSTVNGLESVIHIGPSTIGVDTLFMSDGRIPEVFLRGAGIPENFITYIPSLIGRAIEFYSSFISYSHKDEEFARRLHSRMREEDLRVWYAPEDMKGGRKLHEEIFRAIQIHDKLLLVLSDHSMKSEWVMTEIRRARKVEREENRRKLFPIRLVDFHTIQNWECFDADSGKDLAVELREYYIPDFSNWKDHETFETEFAKLLRDFRATET